MREPREAHGTEIGDRDKVLRHPPLALGDEGGEEGDTGRCRQHSTKIHFPLSNELNVRWKHASSPVLRCNTPK